MEDRYQKIIKILGKNRVKSKIPLKKYTTFRIGGPAALFFEAKTVAELTKAVVLAKQEKIPYFVLGGGSSLLVSDRGFPGLVIKNKIGGIKKLKKQRIEVGSGTSALELLDFCQRNGLSGLEFLTGIPGTIGGAICNNAGTPTEPFYGGSIADVFQKATLFFPNSKVKKASKEWFGFVYRNSRIKKTALNKRPLILNAVFNLRKSAPVDIQKVREIKIKKRAEREPKGFSAGCIFKNPKNNFAGQLIDRAGLKGKRSGRALISEIHANYIINEGGAKAKDVLKLIKLAQKEVQKKFKVKLELEIELIGF